MVHLKESRVLIVGGTSGLGLAVARAVIERGGVPFVASRRQSNVDDALAQLPGAGGIAVDLIDPASIDAMIRAAGPIDHLVYTAGENLELTPLDDLTPEVIETFWRTRYIGAISVIRATRLKLNPAGSVVLTSGTAGQRPASGWALGASICGAMDALTRELALELAPIRVNAVAPGVTRSRLWSSMSDDEVQSMYAGVGAALPVGRIGETDDVALAYVYAMEQEMATGTIITVDGGAVLV
ncbi:MAG: dehydrogenase, short-chain alcohol dehydrogenase like protein [Glaciihabitans sp.]|nr:dehydrogenase, short-chain alcohol dehydrogenase like protein [Glaciihabitans sp.]